VTGYSELIVGVLVKDPDAVERQEFPIRQALPLTIGRASDNQIYLTDLMVKRHHCLIYAEGEQVYLEATLPPSSHTWINGTEVRDRCLLQFGDKILVGRTAFRFEQPPQSAEHIKE
jgi:pSer/pThr/pTyr-binding forkhead associated (FHA) protein